MIVVSSNYERADLYFSFYNSLNSVILLRKPVNHLLKTLSVKSHELRLAFVFAIVVILNNKEEKDKSNGLDILTSFF